MIKRFFYIFSATLFILTAPNRGVKAVTLEKELLEMEEQQKAPPGFNYQAVLRDSNGTPLANTSLTVRLTIQTASDGGTIQWEETHSLSTNQFGLIDVVVGEGTLTGGAQSSFENIPWDASDMFLKVEVDQGSGFTSLGTSQLQSVPYARVAENGMSAEQTSKLASVSTGAEANVQVDWNQSDNTQDDFIKNKPTVATDLSELTDNSNLLGSSGGEANVQADWNQADNTQDDFILNKPTAVSDFTNDAGFQTAADLSFQTASNLTSNANGDLATDSFVFGSSQMDDNGDATNDYRMFFDKSKAASRVGIATGTEWDNANRGVYSFAAGRNNTASGSGSFAGSGSTNNVSGAQAAIVSGLQNISSGTRSFVGSGYRNEATGNGSAVVGGLNNDATGYGSAILGGGSNYTSSNYSTVGGGNSNSATATYATVAGGADNEASGEFSVNSGGFYNYSTYRYSTVGGGYRNYATARGTTISGGESNNASGAYSTVTGYQNTASGRYATIGGGTSNVASGRSTVIPGGARLRASSYGEVALGFYNTIVTPNSATVFNATDRLLTVGNGINGSNRSNALVVLKNGNTTLNGQLTLSDGSSPFTLPNADGSNGQALITDGSGSVSWQTVGGPFSTSSNITSNSGGALASDSFLFGGTQFNDDANTDHDKRMFFEKSSGAFRAGGTTGNYWNSRGGYSFAAGKNNTASGIYSFAGGGAYNIASGQASFVGSGARVYATGQNAVAVGGTSIQSTGQNSTIGGGGGNYANGNFSVIPGGRGLKVDAFGETALGIYNTYASSPSATTRVDGDRLLVIGNGTGASIANRGDALIMLKNGNTTINGQLTLANATPGVAATSSFTLPNTDGSSGQVLSTDGSGSVSWIDPSGIVTVVTNSNDNIAVPDNPGNYIISQNFGAHSSDLVVTLPTNATAGDRITISPNTTSLFDVWFQLNGNTIQSGSGTNTVTINTVMYTVAQRQGRLTLTSPQLTILYDGSTWIPIVGSLVDSV